MASPLPSDEQIRSTITTIRESAILLAAQASSLIEKAAKLEDSLARRGEARTQSIGKPPAGPELDGNH
jgi:hypothetical protein